MPKKQPDKQQVYYRCGVCDDPPEMDFNEMMEHCEKAHSEIVRNTQVQKEMTSHIDGADFYTYSFKVITKSGLVFYQHQYFPRRNK